MSDAQPGAFATWPGVVVDTEGATPGLPLHFGDPSGEQWALEAGRGLVDRADLRVVAVSGPDRQTWLTSLATQVVTGMGPGDSRELLILDPQGHIEHAAAVLDDGENTVLITAASRAETLDTWLDSMRFMLRVDVKMRPDLHVFATAATFGDASMRNVASPHSQPPPRQTGNEADDQPVRAVDLPGFVATWADPWPGVVDGGTEYHQGDHPAVGLQMFLHVVDADQARAFARAWIEAAPKRRPAGWLAWNAMRIAAWRPDVAFEVDDRTIPAELDWLRTAVHINKGCYRGQESVARVLNLGRPPRRLVMLQLDGSRGDLPDVGAPIERGGRRVGTVTSVARHADFGPIALALVMRNVPSSEVFDLDGVAAAQEVIVPVDGKSAASPAQRPGAGLSNPNLRRPDVPAFGGGGAVSGSGNASGGSAGRRG